MEKLAESQYNILQVLKKLIAERGFPPTVREIGEAAHLSSPATTHFHLNKLAEKGYIEKGNGKNRTIKLLVENEFLQKDDDIVDVPLLGKVTAGSPIEAIEMPNEFFPLPANLIAGKKEVFTLKVSGESTVSYTHLTLPTRKKIISDCNQKMIPWLQLFWIRLLS